MKDELTLEEVRRMAAEIGLTRLTEEHLQQLLRAADPLLDLRSAPGLESRAQDR